MKRLNSLLTTTLALALALSLTACSTPEDPATSTEDTSVSTDTGSSNDAGTTSDEAVTYESYYQGLSDLSQSFAQRGEEIAGLQNEFLADYTNLEAQAAFSGMLKEFAQFFLDSASLVPPEDMESLHVTFQEASDDMAELYVQFAEIIESGLDFSTEEAVNEFNEFSQQMSVVSTTYVESLTVIGEELSAKLAG